MSSDHDEPDGLLDDDPALDCILYEEMNKDDVQPSGKGKSGCLGLMLILFLPALYFMIHIVA